MTNPNYRHIAIVMDRSGSMQAIKNDAEGGLASMLTNLGAEAIHSTVSLYQFDSDYEPVYEMTNINDAPRYTLTPRGSTALLDAVGRTITSTGETLAKMPEEERPGVVIVIITTDGHENASKEFKLDQINEMITHQKNVYDWRFMFLAADQDAFAASDAMGIDRGSSLAYASASTSDSYRVGWNLASRLTTNSGASYSVEERAAAMGNLPGDPDAGEAVLKERKARTEPGGVADPDRMEGTAA